LAEPDIDNGGRRKFRERCKSMINIWGGADRHLRAHADAGIADADIVGVARTFSRQG
jgi:hypothetical protein